MTFLIELTLHKSLSQKEEVHGRKFRRFTLQRASEAHFVNRPAKSAGEIGWPASRGPRGTSARPPAILIGSPPVTTDSRLLTAVTAFSQ